VFLRRADLKPDNRYKKLGLALRFKEQEGSGVTGVGVDGLATPVAEVEVATAIGVIALTGSFATS
jgi:hypothetical protein